MYKVLVLFAYLVAAAKCLNPANTQTHQYVSSGVRAPVEERTTTAPRTTVQRGEPTTTQPLPRQVYYCTKVTVHQGQEDHLHAVDQSQAQPNGVQSRLYNYCRKVTVVDGPTDYLYEVDQPQLRTTFEEPQSVLGLQTEEEQARLRQELQERLRQEQEERLRQEERRREEEERERLRQEERERLRQEQLERRRQIQEDLKLQREQAALNLQIQREQQEQLRQQSLIRRQMTEELRAQVSGQLQSQREQFQQTRSDYVGSNPGNSNFRAV